ncbi:uncharacterized protein LOC110455333 [Mizuhopecten yessoensis]|uniref:Uncharacterized protein n=1 Tax=Mizuhopecten yessoensis TaxID=6573 RepID=A0A210QDA5_MIZYE|nr:uncharacterized protein LOC110455333 [Mizuhopecten yessoensis]OWF46710.1 hypothetical protein KP79_PYT21207 [Mizuhopecten yessoensis]
MDRWIHTEILAVFRKCLCCRRKERQWNPINHRKNSKRIRREDTHVHFAKKVNKVTPLQYEHTFTSSDTSLRNSLPKSPSEESFELEDFEEYVENFVDQTIQRATVTLIIELKPRIITTMQDLKDPED